MAFTVKTINIRINEASNGRLPPVYALPVGHETMPNPKVRIIQARMVKGQLQGKSLATGKWINIVETV